MGLSIEMIPNGYKVTYGPAAVEAFEAAIIDQLGAIEALAHPIAGQPIRTDLIIFEAQEIIRLAEKFANQAAG